VPQDGLIRDREVAVHYFIRVWNEKGSAATLMNNEADTNNEALHLKNLPLL